MSQVLVSVELSEDVFFRVEREAESIGISAAQLIADSVSKEFPENPVSDSQGASQSTPLRSKGLARRNFGAANLGFATGLDNEKIDDDLAREYGSNLDAR